ncbi:hypothetical protein FHR07_11375 [Serratia ureilytica]|nr:hypothetical protein [Serratia ureilytica]
MNKASWIKAWFSGATVYTCLDFSKHVGDDFLCGAIWPQLLGIILIFIICFGARSKLNELS